MDRLVNNNASITGEITSGFTFSYEVLGRRIYQMMVAVSRISRQVDVLPVLVAENCTILDVHRDYTGHCVSIEGRFQSHNRIDGTGRHLDLSVYANGIRICKKLTRVPKNTNRIFMEGVICKRPIYRETPLGKKITDLHIAVHRFGTTSDYIPCIVWGSNAKWASCREVGAKVKIEGRVQSREYIKKLSDFESETRVAYEVSANRIWS